MAYYVEPREVSVTFNLTIVFPYLPDYDLSPNGRKHWRAKAKLVEMTRYEAKILGLNNKGNWQAPELAKIHYEFYCKSRAIRDLDNLISACKSWQDGLKDAGIIFKDDGWHLSIGGARLIEAAEDQTRLIIERIE